MAFGEIKITNLENSGDLVDTSEYMVVQPTVEGGLRNTKKVLGSEMKDYMNSLTTGKISTQEVQSVAITTSGWYKVAIVEPSILTPTGARVACVFGDGSIVMEVAKSGESQTVKIVNLTIGEGTNYISGARITTNSDLGGSVLEVNIVSDAISTLMLLTQIMSYGAMTITGASERWKLVSPVTSDGLLSDGITVATYKEAGAEFSYHNRVDTHSCPSICGLKGSSDDEIRVTILWPELVKGDTTSLLIETTGDFLFVDGTGGVSASLGTYSVSDITITDKLLEFVLIQTGIATSLSVNSPLFSRVSGADSKIILS